MISQNRPKKSQKKRIVLIYPNNSQQIAEKNKKKCSLPVPHAPQYGIRLDGGGVWNDPAGMPATGFRGFPFSPVTRGDWQHFKTGTRDTQRVLVPKGWDWYTLTHGHLEPNTHTHKRTHIHTNLHTCTCKHPHTHAYRNNSQFLDLTQQQHGRWGTKIMQVGWGGGGLWMYWAATKCVQVITGDRGRGWGSHHRTRISGRGCGRQ